MEIIPPSTAPPGSTADRAAYLRGKLAAENRGGSGGAGVGKGSGKKSAVGTEGDDTEEFVGEEGGDKMIEMLSAFDDDSDEDK